jgi:hypothetical protein
MVLAQFYGSFRFCCFSFLFSLSDLAGFFFVSFRESLALPMACPPDYRARHAEKSGF